LKLIVGLGNPGRAYEDTRHNIGFMVLDELARRGGSSFRKMFWFPALQARCSLAGEQVRLLKPTTFMNRSGRAVAGGLSKWKLSVSDLVVVYDDLDLPFGSLRVRPKGSAGTHNGMKSLVEWLETDAFARVRVGIGPKPKEVSTVDFVLGAFSPEESLRLEKVVVRAADAVESILSNGVERTMGSFNQREQVKEKDIE
jgi:PTH1 family peptidyl-tRNA hydrolase